MGPDILGYSPFFKGGDMGYCFVIVLWNSEGNIQAQMEQLGCTNKYQENTEISLTRRCF